MDTPRAPQHPSPPPAVKPGPELYNGVRAAFIQQGTSLARWCATRRRRIYRENARAALLGIWRGPKAQRLVRRLIRASGYRAAPAEKSDPPAAAAA